MRNHLLQHTHAIHRQRGFSLIELMVALVLGLVIVGGVINIFITNQQTFRTNNDLGRLQENARISFEQMAREVRQAGGNLCGTPLVSNVLNDKTTNWASNWSAGAVQGFDGNQAATGIVSTGTATAERIIGTDAIKILSGGLNNGVMITDHEPSSAQFKVNTVNHGINDGEIVMVCDLSSAAIVQITNASPGVNFTVVHNTGTGTPGNCSKGLGFPENCSSVNGNPKTFQSGGFITTLTSGTWYIGNNGRGGRSLYRTGMGTGNNGPQEIAEGVTDMQLEYLLKTTATDTLAGNWAAATSVTNWTDKADDLVVAVRLTLTLQTLNNVGTNGQPLQRQLIHVTSLRNRSL